MYNSQQVRIESDRRQIQLPLGAPVTFEEDELVSIKWIAEHTHLSRVTIKRHLDQAGFKSIRFGHARNATLRYRMSDIESWLRSCWLG